jgi:hypothetical protein
MRQKEETYISALPIVRKLRRQFYGQTNCKDKPYNN